MQRLSQLLLLLALLVVANPLFARAPGTVPDTYRSSRLGACLLVLPEQNLGIRDVLADTCTTTAKRIYTQLGASVPAADSGEPLIEVRVVAEPGDLEALSPPGARLPDWTGAVAFPEHRLVILPMANGDGRPNMEMDVMLEHELSHVAFRHVAGEAPVPRWFSEGVAILQSEGSTMGRRSAIWWSSLVDDIRPLKEIERYPRSSVRAQQAYAQAADFTGYVVAQKGWGGIARLLAALNQMPFEQAFAQTYGASVGAIERQWRAQLFGSTDWMLEATSDAVWLGLAALVCIVGFFIVRRRKHRRLVEMEAEERPIERFIESIDALSRKKGPQRLSSKGKPPPPGQEGVQIEVNGEIHTLH